MRKIANYEFIWTFNKGRYWLWNSEIIRRKGYREYRLYLGVIGFWFILRTQEFWGNRKCPHPKKFHRVGDK